MTRELTVAELRRLGRIARTIQRKASDIFNEVETAVGADDRDLLPLAGDTMCSAAELANNFEGRADAIMARRKRQVQS